MNLTVTPIHGAALTALFLALSLRVIAFRRANRISFCDRGDADLLRRIRAQGNFAEYAPLGMLLLLIGDVQGASRPLLRGLGLTLLAERLCHGWGVSLRPRNIALGTAGMGLTLAALAGLAATSLILSRS
jgi:uncharacterized protein